MSPATVDLGVLGVLFLVLAGLHTARVKGREAGDVGDLTTAYRAWFWLLGWHGSGLLIRLSGFA